MKEPMRSPALFTLAAAVLAVAPANGQEQPKPGPEKKVAPEPVWPTVTRAQKQKIQQLCKTLKTTKKPERRDKAEAALVAMGSGVAPVLLARLTDFRVNINEPIGRVLDQVTQPDHAPLLARSAADHKIAVRAYVLERLTTFRLPDMAPVFRHARKDRDEEVSFLAALGLASAGDFEAFDDIFERASANWKELAPRLAVALPGVRGEKATVRVLDKMKAGGENEEITGLRLLRSVADRSAASRVAIYLDSESHNIKKEAINALRVIVDGDPPLENLSVFQAIEMANAWKAKAR